MWECKAYLNAFGSDIWASECDYLLSELNKENTKAHKINANAIFLEKYC